MAFSLIGLGEFESLFSGILYLLVYLFSTFCIFYIFFISKLRQFDSYQLLEFQNLSSIKTINPLLVFMLSINFLSMAGIPPLAGFISKFIIFLCLIEFNLLVMLFILLIFSLISAYYYIRPIKILFFENNVKLNFFKKISFFSSLIVTLGFFFNIFLIIQPRIFFFIENVIV